LIEVIEHEGYTVEVKDGDIWIVGLKEPEPRLSLYYDAEYFYGT